MRLIFAGARIPVPPKPTRLYSAQRQRSPPSMGGLKEQRHGRSRSIGLVPNPVVNEAVHNFLRKDGGHKPPVRRPSRSTFEDTSSTPGGFSLGVEGVQTVPAVRLSSAHSHPSDMSSSVDSIKQLQRTIVCRQSNGDANVTRLSRASTSMSVRKPDAAPASSGATRQPRQRAKSALSKRPESPAAPTQPWVSHARPASHTRPALLEEEKQSENGVERMAKAAAATAIRRQPRKISSASKVRRDPQTRTRVHDPEELLPLKSKVFRLEKALELANQRLSKMRATELEKGTRGAVPTEGVTEARDAELAAEKMEHEETKRQLTHASEQHGLVQKRLKKRMVVRSLWFRTQLIKLERLHALAMEVDGYLQPELTCPGCMELYEGPHTLNVCGHGVCKACVTRLQKSNTKGGLLECFECGQNSTIAAPNQAVDRILSRYGWWSVVLQDCKQAIHTTAEADVRMKSLRVRLTTSQAEELNQEALVLPDERPEQSFPFPS